MTPDEAVNVRVYKQAASAVANIVTRTITYDFFMGAVPSEGAGSGFLIDAQGHVLTNFHVVQGAQRIEVTLGDRSSYTAKFLGGDPRNDMNGGPGYAIRDEINLQKYTRGAVGMAHAGDPTQADSQFYILRNNAPSLNGKYVIFGQVISGMDVVDQVQVGDVIKRMYVKEAAK